MSEFGTEKVGNEDELTALERFLNKAYDGVFGVLCVCIPCTSAHRIRMATKK